MDDNIETIIKNNLNFTKYTQKKEEELVNEEEEIEEIDKFSDKNSHLIIVMK
jgi:hypothetical protein